MKTHSPISTHERTDVIPVSEIFVSIQGEGLYVGQQQRFVRLSGCNMHCGFCDEALKSPNKNYTSDELSEAIIALRTATRVVSFTGGEPLCHAAGLREVMRSLRDEGYHIYLETNGTLPAALGEVIALVDVIAMDIKLPSVTGDQAFWAEHAAFLRQATETTLFVKIPVTAGTDSHELIQAFSLISNQSPAIPCIIQPVIPSAAKESAEPTWGQLTHWAALAQGIINDIRIIPQLHKLLGIR